MTACSTCGKCPCYEHERKTVAVRLIGGGEIPPVATPVKTTTLDKLPGAECGDARRDMGPPEPTGGPDVARELADYFTQMAAHEGRRGLAEAWLHARDMCEAYLAEKPSSVDAVPLAAAETASRVAPSGATSGRSSCSVCGEARPVDDGAPAPFVCLQCRHVGEITEEGAGARALCFVREHAGAIRDALASDGSDVAMAARRALDGLESGASVLVYSRPVTDEDEAWLRGYDRALVCYLAQLREIAAERIKSLGADDVGNGLKWAGEIAETLRMPRPPRGGQ